MYLRSAAILLFVCMFVAGCISTHSDTAADIDPLGWSAAEPPMICLENDDTVSLRDISFFIRHNGDMQPRSVPVRIRVMAPDSSSFSEDFTLGMAQPGSGREFEIPYRDNVVLGMPGTYTFAVINLSGTVVRGITALGLKTKPAKNPRRGKEALTDNVPR